MTALTEASTPAATMVMTVSTTNMLVNEDFNFFIRYPPLFLCWHFAKALGFELVVDERHEGIHDEDGK